MTPEEAHEHLAAIRRVIDRSRAERARSGDIYVVWGLVILAADLITLATDSLGIPYGWMSWPLGSVVGMSYAAIVSRRRELRVQTFGTRIEGTLWISMGVAMSALIFGGLATGLMDVAFIVPMVCAMVAVAMTTSAALFDSWLMRGSAALFFVTSIAALSVPWQTQYLLFAGAIAVGYIGPGLWWMWEERRARDA